MLNENDSLSLRYRKANSRSDELGQVFTPAHIARLLLSGAPRTCNRLLDLGSGQGALSQAATEYLNINDMLLIDCDSECFKAVEQSRKEGQTAIHGNVFDTDWEINWGYGRFNDIIVSNPPYGMIALSPEQFTSIARSSLPLPPQGVWVRGDAAFLAKAWYLATKGTSIAFIVTSPIVSGHEYRLLREKLVRELRGLVVTQLDEKSFPGAEVRAFLLNGERASARQRGVLLRKADLAGNITDELRVSYSEAIQRLDIEFHRARERLALSSSLTGLTLKDVGTVVVRGSRSKKDFEKLGISAFHTTDFALSGENIELADASEIYRCAAAGDILIPRVGSRCLTRHARVVLGEGTYTDCVYRIRSPKEVQDRVWKTIASNFGCEWREAYASGNCARHLTQKTLLSMPIIN
jgi:hypothetical protein